MSHDGHSHITVEDLALEHFALPEHGSWTGVHSESGVWSTLFGILLWDVLFAPVPDVFRSRFQSAPLDLCTDAFAPARADVLQRALKRISSGSGLEMLESIWEQHEGVCAYLTTWLLYMSCECMLRPAVLSPTDSTVHSGRVTRG